MFQGSVDAEFSAGVFAQRGGKKNACHMLSVKSIGFFSLNKRTDLEKFIPVNGAESPL